MNKTAQIELHREFLIDSLPEPLTASSSHLQIFDNYVENTRLRLRKIRDPYSGGWTRILQQRFPTLDSEPPMTRLAEIYLSDVEYALFERLEGREIRKNRYFHEFDGVACAFDVYLGDLSGLHTMKVDFETREQMVEFEPPPFTVFEVTSDPFFSGQSLVSKGFDDVRSEVERLGTLSVRSVELVDE